MLSTGLHFASESTGAIFGLRMSATSINCIKISATKQYETTYRSILQRIVAGSLVHADETQVMIKGKARYVWVFTSLEDVAYVYSESRDGSTAQDLLEPLRVDRRLFRLSHAAMAGSFSMA